MVWFWMLLKILHPAVVVEHSKIEKTNAYADEKSLPLENVDNQVDAGNALVPPYEQTKIFTEFSDNDIRKGQVQWQDPKDLGDLGWTIPDVYKGTYQYDARNQNNENQLAHPIGGIRYVQVGSVIGGKYEGMDVLVVAVWIMDGPGSDAPYIYHFLRKDGQFVFLQYADAQSDINVNEGGNAYFHKIAIFDSEYVFKKDGINASKIPNFVFDEDTRIEDLASFPTKFFGKDNKGTFVKDTYYSRGFFSEKGLKKVFVHDDLGSIWIPKKNVSQQYPFNAYTEKSIDPSVSHKQNEEYKYILAQAYFEPLSVGGIYARRMDGIIQAYALKADILDEQNHFLATWKDGMSNMNSYSNEPDSCGFHVYISDVSGYVDVKKDLSPIGKTNGGETLYGLKNTDQKIFKQIYKEAVDSYSNGGNKPFSNEDEFLALKPLVYWIDSLGRVIEFHNTDAIQPVGGCGKPVIYLYPEKITNVSVHVFPSQGVSVSEPYYGDGWNVTAHPDGTIMNKSDNKDYPYLFWEGGSDALYRTPKQGFVSSNDGLEAFFDDKLNQLGLSQKETEDFKEFWVPKMRKQNKPYYFVTFLSRDHIDRIAPLKIDPRPETIIRIMMDYEGLDAWRPIVGYDLKKQKRSGFTVVEWGGRLQD